MFNKSKIVLILLLTLMLIIVGCGSPATEAPADEQPSPSDNEPKDVERIEAFSGAEFKGIDEAILELAKEDVRSLQSIEEVYVNGSLLGYKILVTPNGYEGPMEVFTFLNLEGEIQQVLIGEHGETVGIGSQIEEPAYVNRYHGVNSSAGISTVDGLSGATFSSGAVKDGVTRAFNIFNSFLKD